MYIAIFTISVPKTIHICYAHILITYILHSYLKSSTTLCVCVGKHKECTRLSSVGSDLKIHSQRLKLKHPAHNRYGKWNLPSAVILSSGITADIVFSMRYLLWFKSFIHSFIHTSVRPSSSITAGPQPLPKPFLHRVRYSASSFSFQYALVFLTSSSSCLRLLPRLLVTPIPSHLPFKNVF